MKLLITGGAGFIGSAVVRLAIAQGHEVVVLDALTYAAALMTAAGFRRRMILPHWAGFDKSASARSKHLTSL